MLGVTYREDEEERDEYGGVEGDGRAGTELIDREEEDDDGEGDEGEDRAVRHFFLGVDW